MKLQLFTNESEDIKVNKSINFSSEYNGYLRVPSSLTHPIIDIELKEYEIIDNILDVVYEDNDVSYIDGDDEYEVDAYTAPITIFQLNYAYIEDFKRFYYITKIDIINNNIFRLYLDEDYLMSIKDKFLELNALVERNEFTYNDLIEDNLACYNYNKSISFISLVDARWDKFDTNINREGSYYCYNIIWSKFRDGDDITIDSEGLSGEVSPTQQGYAKKDNVIALSNKDDLEVVVEGYTRNDVSLSFCKHITVYPFVPKHLGPTYHQAVPIKPDVEYDIINYKNVEIVTDKLIIAEYTFPEFESYMDYSPYTKYELYAPFHKYIQLNPEDISGSFIQLYYLVNYLSGEATVNVTAKKGFQNTRLLYSAKCQLGTRIPLSSTNSYEIDRIRNGLIVSSAIDGITKVMEIGVGGVAQNPGMMLQGSTGLLNLIGSTYARANQLYVTGTIDASSGNFNNFNPLVAHLKITKINKASFDNLNYKTYIGKPLMAEYKLNRLSGFTKISSIHLDNINSLEEEKKELHKLLLNGVIL